MLSKYQKNKEPLFEKCGQKLTEEVFEGQKKLSETSRKILLTAIEQIQYSTHPEVLLVNPNNLKITINLLYCLGYACEVGKISCKLVNLEKPILIIGVDITIKKLERKLCTRTFFKAPAHFHFIPNDERDHSVFCRTFVVKDSDDARRVDLMREQCNVILCNDTLCEYLPEDIFSIVLVNWSKSMKEVSIRARLEKYCKVLVVKYCGKNTPKEKHYRKTMQLKAPPLVYSSKIISKEIISPFLTQMQLYAVDNIVQRVSDTGTKSIPLEINAIPNPGMEIIIGIFPYLLRGAALRNRNCLDLNKPILMVAMDEGAWLMLRRIKESFLTGELMTEEECAKYHYKSSFIENEFDLTTYDGDIFDSEVVFTREDTILSCCKKTYDRSFKLASFSTIVALESKPCTFEREMVMIDIFCGFFITFLRLSNSVHIPVFIPTVLSTIQHYGAEVIQPKLRDHGRLIRCHHLLGPNSLLNKQQQEDLVSLVDQIIDGRNCSSITTSIRYDEACTLLMCVPVILNRIRDNHLIPYAKLYNNIPILIVCENNQSLLKVFQNCVSLEPTIYSSSKSDCCQFYLVSDKNSATNIKQYRKYKVIFSEVCCVNYFPNDFFSIVIIFSNEMTSEYGETIHNKFPQSMIAYYRYARQYTDYIKQDRAGGSEIQRQASTHVESISSTAIYTCSAIERTVEENTTLCMNDKINTRKDDCNFMSLVSISATSSLESLHFEKPGLNIDNSRRNESICGIHIIPKENNNKIVNKVEGSTSHDVLNEHRSKEINMATVMEHGICSIDINNKSVLHGAMNHTQIKSPRLIHVKPFQSSN